MNNLNIAVVSSYIPVRYIKEILKETFLSHESVIFTSRRNKIITTVLDDCGKECKNTYHLMSTVNRDGLSDRDLNTPGQRFDQIIFVGSFNRQIYYRLGRYLTVTEVPKFYDDHNCKVDYKCQTLMPSLAWESLIRSEGYVDNVAVYLWM